MAVVNWREIDDEEYGVIGNPITHSWSPRLFAAAFNATGMNYRYVAISCESDEFERALSHLRRKMKGLNVTAPFKGRVGNALGRNQEGPCNGIAFERIPRLFNCDRFGLVEALNELGLKGKTLVLGSGGAAQAACTAIHVSTGMEVFNWNRRGVAIEDATPVEPSTKEFDVIINATGALPSLDWCGKGAAYDMSYGVEPTPFLGQASAHGWATYDGRLMLLHQAICSFRHWFKDPAPVDAMREGLP